MNEIFFEKFVELKDICKIIYDDSSKSRGIGYLKCYKLRENELGEGEYLYYRLYIMDSFFPNQGAPVLSYAISNLEPKDFLFWDFIKNEIRMEEKGKKMLENEVVILIAKIEKLPQFITEILPQLT